MVAIVRLCMVAIDLHCCTLGVFFGDQSYYSKVYRVKKGILQMYNISTRGEESSLRVLPSLILKK